MTIVVFGLLGIIIAAVIYTMNANGILLDEFITGTISVTDVMTVTVIVFSICGVIIAALVD